MEAAPEVRCPLPRCVKLATNISHHTRHLVPKLGCWSHLNLSSPLSLTSEHPQVPSPHPLWLSIRPWTSLAYMLGGHARACRGHRQPQVSFFWCYPPHCCTGRARNWYLTIRLDRVARKPPGTCLFSSPRGDITTVYHHARLVAWVLGIVLESSCLCGKLID